MIGIYKITNLKNGMVYIGSSSHIEDRKEYHFRLGKTYDEKRHNQLYNDIYTYGSDNFTFDIICECQLEELEDYEKAEIDKYPPEKLYNRVKKVSKVLRGVNSSQAKLNEQQLAEIIELLKENKISDREIAKRYNICFNAISEINHGISYHNSDLEYPIRVFKQISKNRFFTDEQVRQYREEYEANGHQSKLLYEKYKLTCSYGCFRQMLTRKTYQDID